MSFALIKTTKQTFNGHTLLPKFEVVDRDLRSREASRLKDRLEAAEQDDDVTYEVVDQQQATRAQQLILAKAEAAQVVAAQRDAVKARVEERVRRSTRLTQTIVVRDGLRAEVTAPLIGSGAYDLADLAHAYAN
jgi:hypothetical protein